VSRPTLTIIAGANGAGKSTLTAGSPGTFAAIPLLDPDAIASMLRLAKEHLDRREFCYVLPVPFGPVTLRPFAIIELVRLGQLPGCFSEQWQCFEHRIDLLGYPALGYSAFNN
jgi:ABC-type cobalamin/Fe3+-siderophores transport system ATPase subunit